MDSPIAERALVVATTILLALPLLALFLFVWASLP